MLKRYPRGVLTAMGLRFAENILYYLVVVFAITYLRIAMEYDVTRILGLMALAHVAHMIFVPLVGSFVDSVGRRPVNLVGAITGASWGFIAFPMFQAGNGAIILLGIVLGLLFHALMYAGQPAIMAEIFPTRMRCSGVSLGYQVTSIVAGSLAPAIATVLLAQFGSHIPVALYLAAVCAITVVAACAKSRAPSDRLRRPTVRGRAARAVSPPVPAPTG